MIFPLTELNVALGLIFWLDSQGHVKVPLHTQRRRNVVCRIPCSECPSAYVGQTDRQFATCMKQHQTAVRRQDGNSLLALHCLTICHAFDWTRASIVGIGLLNRPREFIEAWKTSINQWATTDPCYKALRAYWKGKSTKSQAVSRQPLPLSFFNVNCLFTPLAFVISYFKSNPPTYLMYFFSRNIISLSPHQCYITPY